MNIRAQLNDDSTAPDPLGSIALANDDGGKVVIISDRWIERS